jgi:hypothetical protein
MQNYGLLKEIQKLIKLKQYDEATRSFLESTQSTIDIEFLKNDKYFKDDLQKRDIYNITILRDKRKMVFTFGQSLANKGVKPSFYDILTCLEKSEFQDFNDFCLNLGYDNDSIKALEIFEAYKKQLQDLQKLYNDFEIKILQEIQ